jgi:hypothetical protein
MSESDLRSAAAYLKIAVFLAIAGNLVMYAIPSLLETAVVPYLGAKFVAFALGDLAGCLIFWTLGFGRRALVFYVLATALKTVSLLSGSVAPHTLIWLSDMVPTLAWMVMSFVCTAELSQAIMSSLDPSSERY